MRWFVGFLKASLVKLTLSSMILQKAASFVCQFIVPPYLGVTIYFHYTIETYDMQRFSSLVHDTEILTNNNK